MEGAAGGQASQASEAGYQYAVAAVRASQAVAGARGAYRRAARLRGREALLLAVGVAAADHCLASKVAAVHCFMGSNMAVPGINMPGSVSQWLEFSADYGLTCEGCRRCNCWWYLRTSGGALREIWGWYSGSKRTSTWRKGRHPVAESEVGVDGKGNSEDLRATTHDAPIIINYLCSAHNLFVCTSTMLCIHSL